MIVILTATKEEYELAKKYLAGYRVVQTGVGASNVIHTLSQLIVTIPQAHFINVGFSGSNKLPVGTVTKVSYSYRMVDENVKFQDFRNGFFLEYNGYQCYTNNSFVTESTSEVPVLYDMELNYIVAFPIDLIGAVKIVSDNLDVLEYETNIDTSTPEIWGEVRKLVDDLASKRE